MAATSADPNAASERILLLAPFGRDAAAAAALLHEAGLTADIVAGLPALCEELAAGAGVAVIAEEALYRGPAACLVAWVEAQPSWSDFPFVVLTRGGRPGSDHRTRVRLLQALRNVALLERPLHAITLVSAVHTALRARRRQYETRGHLHEREAAALRLEALVAERTAELEAANRRLRAEIGEREQAEAALRQAQKMEVIGQLTGGVAHDFNNLLTAVLGNLELALGQVMNDAGRRLVGNAERAARRGARLTEQLLAFARKQRLEPEIVDLNGLLSRMGDLLTRTIGGTVRVEMALQPDLWPALIDASQIELVILNLAINARDAMPGGGRVVIATANIGARDPRLPPELAAGDYIAVSVKDTGVGMSDEVLAKAFEPFFTTKDVGQGTGLGLSQVYGVTQQSGGSVRIASRLGRGTTVTVYLPRAAGAASDAAGEPVPAMPRREHGTVLVVDDDPDVRELAVASLESLGYHALAAEGGAAALAVLAGDAEIDLLLIDYAMPELNGRDLVARVRGDRAGLPILIMTGYADTEALYGGDAAWDGVLKKPFMQAELAAALKSAAAKATTRRRRAAANVVPIRPPGQQRS